MSTGISANYEGEGPNVSGALKNTLPSDAAASGPNPTTTGAGKQLLLKADRRSRLRTNSEGVRSMAAINYGGGDQILTNVARAVYITTGGTLVLRCAEDTADQTVTNLLAGTVYPFHVALIRQTNSTAAGFLLF